MDEKAVNLVGDDEAEEVSVSIVAESKSVYKAANLELQTAQKICTILEKNNNPKWDEATASLFMEENGKLLKGKEVYNTLLGEAGSYIRSQILSGNQEKGMEMTELVKEAGKYASRYYAKQKERISVREKLKEKQADLNRPPFDVQKNVTKGKNNIEL